MREAPKPQSRPSRCIIEASRPTRYPGHPDLFNTGGTTLSKLAAVLWESHDLEVWSVGLTGPWNCTIQRGLASQPPARFASE